MMYTMRSYCYIFCRLVFLAIGWVSIPAGSQSLTGRYKELSALSMSPKPGNTLDAIHFPEKEFRRMAYLKLRTVYLNVSPEVFKVSPPPANSSLQTRA
jgi:hypothetical protein